MISTVIIMMIIMITLKDFDVNTFIMFPLLIFLGIILGLLVSYQNPFFNIKNYLSRNYPKKVVIRYYKSQKVYWKEFNNIKNIKNIFQKTWPFYISSLLIFYIFYPSPTNLNFQKPAFNISDLAKILDTS